MSLSKITQEEREALGKKVTEALDTVEAQFEELKKEASKIKELDESITEAYEQTIQENTFLRSKIVDYKELLKKLSIELVIPNYLMQEVEEYL